MDTRSKLATLSRIMADELYKELETLKAVALASRDNTVNLMARYILSARLEGQKDCQQMEHSSLFGLGDIEHG